MNKDLRLAIGFIDHPKVLKLEARLGFEGIKCLLRLWSFVATNKPTGELTGMDGEDVELSARWTGEPGAFFEAVTSDKCRWIDIVDGRLVMHDWEEHQGYVVHAPERRARAKRAADRRWGNPAKPAREPEPKPKPQQRPTEDETPDTTVEGLRALHKQYGFFDTLPAHFLVMQRWIKEKKTLKEIRAAYEKTASAKTLSGRWSWIVDLVEGKAAAEKPAAEPKKKKRGGTKYLDKRLREEVNRGEEGVGENPGDRDLPTVAAG